MEKQGKETFYRTLVDRQLEEFAVRQAARKQGNQKKAVDGGDFMFTLPLPFQPEFASPERVQYPIDRSQQNRYWRLYYKLDPVIGNVIDLFGDIISSDLGLSGEGVDGEVKDTYERMIDTTKIVALFPYFVREFLVMGEVIPHTIFNKAKGIWTGLIFHNPDQIKVVDSPFIEMEPIVEFVPDAGLRALMRSKGDQIQKIIQNLPQEVVQSIISGKNIVLDTSLNTTFIARKIHPYDVRGTSILTRLYRVLMYEDAIANASIATARRHAGPLKIAKLGDKELNWVPEKEYEDKIMQLLAAAEMDPHAFLILPWFVQFEAFGTTDRMLTIRNEWDVIERIKLTALGVSQGFLHGEATYSSMKGNMQTLFMKLRGLRTFFESVWWYPKFFKPVAEMNKFIKPTKAEVSHRLRTRRSKRELDEDDRYIIPKIQWARALDPKIDAELLDALEQIQTRLKIDVARSTVYTAAGLDFEEQITTIIEEEKKESELRVQLGVPPEEPEGLSEETPLEEVGEEEVKEELAEGASKNSKVSGFTELLKIGKTKSKFWDDFVTKRKEKGKHSLQDLKFEEVVDYVDGKGYSIKEIQDLRRSFIRRSINGKVVSLSPDMSDTEFDTAVADILKKKEEDSVFFVGAGNKNNVGGG